MGYSAEIIHSEGEPNDALGLILPDRYEAVWAALEAAERDRLGTHISWCEPLVTYQGTLGERIQQVLRSFGFDGAEVGDDGVHLNFWGEDKLGSCWDNVLAAIAVGLDPELTVTWYLTGEDGNSWAERFHGGKFKSHDIKMEVI